jgi:peptidoglycan/LPS O-acetylase OafA/YrhL
MRNDSPNLDVLRSLAVFLVVFSHIPVITAFFGAQGYNIQPIGLVGVLIFFVHTSLVLQLSLERDAEKEKSKRALFFFIRRLFRIYPLSVVVVLIVAGVSRLPPGEPLSISEIITNLLLIQNITGHRSVVGTLWSLPYEVQMYLFLPSLFTVVTLLGGRAPRYLIGIWGGAICLIFAVSAMKWNYHLIKYFPCFLPGVLAFSLRALSRKFPPAVLFLYVGFVVIIFPWLVNQYGVRENIAAWPVCLLLGLLIPICREIKSTLLKQGGKIIARYSYGVYLVHLPIAQYAFSIKGVSSLMQWSVFVVGTVIMSFLAYHLIEQPGIRLGRDVVEALRKRNTGYRYFVKMIDKG